MIITEHAIHRYKQRIGKRTAARKRIIARINHDLKNDVWFRKTSHKEDETGAYILVTSKFQAVCIKGHVVTIEELTPFLKGQIERLKAQEQRRMREKRAGRDGRGDGVGEFVG